MSGARSRAPWVAAIMFVLILGATLAARRINALQTFGDIKSDEATYISMTLSLVHDGDLYFEKADLDRFLALYPRGPEGIFLKRMPGVPSTTALAYGKSLLYAVAAAPFAALGGVGGLFVFNVCLLLLCVACAVRFCQARMGPVSGAIMGAAFVGASVVPVYIAFLMPEMLNVTLVFAAYFFWLYKEVAPPTAWPGWRRAGTDLLAAALIGLATYSKLTPALLLGPLVLAALFRRRWNRAASMVGVWAVVVLVTFGGHTWLTGEWNYQGAATADGRKTFNGAFPFDSKGTTYDDYRKDDPGAVTNDTGSENTTTADVFLRLLPRNIPYFFIGRTSGLIPFFFPGFLITLAWLFRWRKATGWQVAVFLGLVTIGLAWLIIAPYSWNGGGGPPGNRYFLGTYPIMLFLLPSGFGAFAAMTATIAGVAFTGRMDVTPIESASRPWLAVERAPLRWLPIELTLTEQFPWTLVYERHRIPFHHDPEIYFDYPSRGGYFVEGDGFWVAGDAPTDLLVRTEEPIRQVTLKLSGNPMPNEVTVSLTGQSQTVSVIPGKTETITFTPRPGVWAHKSYAVVLHFETTAGFVPAKVDPKSTDTRNLGVFVRPTFVVADPPPGR